MFQFLGLAKPKLQSPSLAGFIGLRPIPANFKHFWGKFQKIFSSKIPNQFGQEVVVFWIIESEEFHSIKPPKIDRHTVVDAIKKYQ